MKQLRVWTMRLIGLFRTEQQEQELAEEMQSHLQLHIDDNLRSGMMPEQARRDAILKLGGVEQSKQATRERSTIPFIENLLRDVRYALRQLRKSPGFAVTAILTFALGIGAVTAVFQVADEALFHPLPYRDAHRIVMLWGHDRSKPEERALLSAMELRQFRRSNTFAAIAGIDLKQLSFALTGAGKPRQIAAAHVTRDLFHVFGVPPLLGQNFRLKNTGESVGTTAVISYRLWQEHFHSDPAVLGKSINLDGVTYTVVAVMPTSFHFPIRYQNEDLEAWMPESLDPMIKDPVLRNAGTLLTFAKVPTGISLIHAQQQLNVNHALLLRNDPDTNQNRRVGLYSLNGELGGAHRTELFLLLGAVAVLLLIACTNVANLLLARGTARRQEMALRVALGAGRMTLLRQMLSENILLACVGTLCALIVTKIGARILALYIQAQPGGTGFAHLLSAPALSVASFPKSAFLFMAGILTITILLAGFAPALALSNVDGMEALKSQGRASSGKQVTRLRTALLVGQISLSLVLAIGAILLVRSFDKFINIDPGFQIQHRLTYQLTLPTAKYPTGTVQARFSHNLLTKIEALPGVESAAIIGGLPLTTWMKLGQFLPDSLSVTRAGDLPVAQNRSVSANYFAVMDIPVLRGRAFMEGTEGNAPKEVVISQSLAKMYWPNTSPIGHHMKFDLDSASPSYTIVGVVGDVHQNTLDKNTGAEYYQSYSNDPDRSIGLVVRTPLGAASMQRPVERALHALDPDQPFAYVAPFSGLVEEASRPQRTSFMLFSLVSGIALLLTAVGIFGLISYLVSQRTREIGIRLTLGSGRDRVIWAVVKDAMEPVGLGICIGVVAALSLSGVMRNLLFGVSPFDHFSYVAAIALLIALALAACALPAYRAASTDPIQALRTE